MTARAWGKAYDWEQVRARQTTAKARATAAAAPLADEAPAALPAPRPAVVAAPEPAADDEGQELILEELTRDQVLDWCYRAADHQLVCDHIDRYGEHSAQRCPGTCEAAGWSRRDWYLYVPTGAVWSGRPHAPA
ncbi:hypothetical protein [Streptomyces telluris]|uniref:Uncharacterized protein n=1 Tax=Streptomyces telluris TaxID=2720021 RepID=A0A9X2LIB8_9ACTN|nr:hypothetical protein [Streptomyces telluris]MCQ8771352.1 hypothetical protein [Streptomyces telluris]NJP81613.1 hypothetical protein [Streptomyces telluris]